MHIELMEVNLHVIIYLELTGLWKVIKTRPPRFHWKQSLRTAEVVLEGTLCRELCSNRPSPRVITTSIPTASAVSVYRNNEKDFIRINHIINITHYVDSLHSYAKMSFGVIIASNSCQKKINTNNMIKISRIRIQEGLITDFTLTREEIILTL